jgi:two-component system response regulator CpxR
VSRKPTILVVDDEPQVCALIRGILEEDGHDVLEAWDGETAKEVLDKSGAGCDLALVDIVMPRMNGFQLGREMEGRGVAVLYMTADLRLQEELGQDRNFLPKPFRIEELRRRVQTMLRRQRTSHSSETESSSEV